MYEYGNGLIECLDCTKNYRGKNERGKIVYFCSGYHNKQTDCKRYQLEEEELNYLVVKHMAIIGKRIEEGKSPRDYITKIEVSGKNEAYTIYYKDNTQTVISPDRLIY